jgi:16S rRNA C1402 N4-methylase RsmH
MTFGAGGHTEGLLNANPKSKVFSLDRDPFALGIAEEISKKYP